MERGAWWVTVHRVKNNQIRQSNNTHTTWKTVQMFLKKLKIKFPYDPVISLLGVHLEKNENCKLKKIHAYQCS